MELTKDAKKKLADWFASLDTGVSSKAIAITALTGFAPGRAGYPHDPADFGRCARLIAMVPEVRDIAFPALAETSEVWARLVKRWDHIHAAMEDEVGIDWRKAKRAPYSYNLMKDVIYGKATA